MFLLWNLPVVVRIAIDFLIAIKSQAKLDLSPHIEDGEGQMLGLQLPEVNGQGACGKSVVERRRVQAQHSRDCQNDGDESDET